MEEQFGPLEKSIKTIEIIRDETKKNEEILEDLKVVPAD